MKKKLCLYSFFLTVLLQYTSENTSAAIHFESTDSGESLHQSSPETAPFVPSLSNGFNLANDGLFSQHPDDETLALIRSLEESEPDGEKQYTADSSSEENGEDDEDSSDESDTPRPKPVSRPTDSTDKNGDKKEESAGREVVSEKLSQKQERITDEQLLAHEPEEGVLAKLTSWLPGFTPLLASASGAYTTSLVIESKVIQSLVFLTLFAGTYVYDMFKDAATKPGYYIEYHGRLREVLESNLSDRLSTDNSGTPSYSEVTIAMRSVDLSRLFAEFCRKMGATEAQYPFFLTSFYLATMTVWAGTEALKTDESNGVDSERLRALILRCTLWTVRVRKNYDELSNCEPAPADAVPHLDPDSVVGTELLQGGQESMVESIILTESGNNGVLIERIRSLPNGYYTLSSRLSLLRIDRSREQSPYTFFYPLLQKEYHFTNPKNLGHYLTANSEKVVVSPLPFDQVFSAIFGKNRLIYDYQEALAFMQFEEDNPPTLTELNRRYRDMAKKMHPDKNPDDPAAELNFQKLQQSKIRLESYIGKTSHSL